MMGFGMRFRALVSVVGVLLSVMAVNALAASQVKSVRLWRAPDNTRLVFDLTGPVQHSVFTLTAPDRLVIDINGATLAGPLNVQTANTPISSMRSAQRTPTDLRGYWASPPGKSRPIVRQQSGRWLKNTQWCASLKEPAL